MPLPVNSHEIFVGKNVKVTVDNKSRTKIINFPFEFPDGGRGVLIMCRVNIGDWVPHEEISSVEIKFKQK
jgi:hypothetical protein